jgi:predicted transcriptional regulator
VAGRAGRIDEEKFPPEVKRRIARLRRLLGLSAIAFNSDPTSMVYGLYTVRRTQVYLDDRQATKLRSVARATQRTVSEIIREAIDEKLDRPDEGKAFDSALAQAAGIWADRDDLGSTDDYVRRLRRDRRGGAVP